MSRGGEPGTIYGDFMSHEGPRRYIEGTAATNMPEELSCVRPVLFRTASFT
jgi:hypothetical protein